MAQSSKREQLVKTAMELFTREGFHAVGVDAIAARAGVTKKTLYHHFKSKDELILTVLRNHDERFRNDFMRSVEARAASPAGRLLAVFDVAGEWFEQDDFYGCLFVGAMYEYPDVGTAVRSMCREAKNLVLDYIKELAGQAQLEQPDQLSEQLLLLLEGAITMAQINKSPLSAVHAKRAAAVLIENSRAPVGQPADS
ncbi:MAG: TetR/AcrR family transcriptional regulator [Nitrospinales bacterium]